MPAFVNGSPVPSISRLAVASHAKAFTSSESAPPVILSKAGAMELAKPIKVRGEGLKSSLTT